MDYQYATKDCRNVLDVADGKTNKSDSKSKDLCNETKGSGNDDDWITVRPKRRRMMSPESRTRLVSRKKYV